MHELIEKEKLKRTWRSYSDEEAGLIRTGGYVSQDDYLWEDVLLTVVLKKPILLKGPTGAGKTKLADSISFTFQQPMHSINCSVDLDAEALLGFKTIVQKEGNTEIEFVEGPVVKAMKAGHLLYIDEINMAKPETLPILHSVLDYRRVLTNPFTGEVIQAHPDFSVIAAINEGYIGTAPMNEALKNRFISFPVSYLDGDELKKLLVRELPHLSDALIGTMLNISQDLTTQVKNGLLSDEAASIRSLMDAAELAHYIGPVRAVHYSIAEKLEDRGERELIMELVKTWVK